MKVRVGEGSQLEWDLGVVEYQRRLCCWASSENKNHNSRAERFSLSTLSLLTKKQKAAFPSDGGTFRNRHTKMHTHTHTGVIWRLRCSV